MLLLFWWKSLCRNEGTTITAGLAGRQTGGDRTSLTVAVFSARSDERIGYTAYSPGTESAITVRSASAIRTGGHKPVYNLSVVSRLLSTIV